MFTRQEQHLQKQKHLRNIGIAAHIDAGKTTTTERILFLTGVTHRIGNVDAGTTTTDHLPEEKARGITIAAAAIETSWKRAGETCILNVIDTPGHVDFTIEVERSMRVLDGAVAVLDASQGVEPQSETIWRQAERYRVPRIVFVNKMDKVGADHARVLQDLQEKLGAKALPVQIPIGEGVDFVGLVDLIELQAFTFEGLQAVAAALPAEALLARQKLIEGLAEVHDGMLEQYMAGSEVSAAQLRHALREVTLQELAFPVLCGSALKDKGIPMLLDAIIDFLPSPEERPVPESIPYGALSALAFKVVTDKFGKLTFVRVYSGTLRTGEYVWNASTESRERINRLVKLKAQQEMEVAVLQAGEIGAIRGLKHTLTGHTLTHEESAHVLETLHVPEPVIMVALEAANPAEQEKLSAALLRFAQEDPTLRPGTDADTGRLVLAGMGELHLEVTLERLIRESGLQVRTGAPKVAYRETLKRLVQVTYTHRKQNGGKGQFAQVTLEVTPLPEGTGFVFENRTVGGSIPRQFIPAIEKGAKLALTAGLSGFPVTDLKVAVLDGKSHSTDSNEASFMVAGQHALRQAFQDAGMVLLEPVMQLEVFTPLMFTGDVISDLQSRRATIQGLSGRGNAQWIEAQVPLAELFQYTTRLRSLTQGRAQASMKPSYHQPLPDHLALEA
ncbi:elongation factor G [Deinococcus roseus]|uniref:Elongation factor G n=1 Tax=Deinococcus roseus TaxID=392414 RepID=A0ABQ2CVY4_9DEIO|nr:elongation factor G [Deinococcus roseus]GGJ25908.1 elongation factor G [Deinococcus roseus]